jgi:Mlc titration factor MtfA (ptsG expression regulator)
MFFDVPDDLRAEYPDVYDQLARYFKQDLAAAA